ncbi:MAG: response regulator [Deltaproteobacteria bacterium]|jgi:PAS domain S-box-containing protein|nr:response regulator [Syntrophaceae bacterium]
MKDIPLYNSMIIKTYLEYLEKEYPELNTRELLDYADIANYEVEDKGHWLTQTQVNRFHEYISRVTANPDFAKQAGRYMGSPQSAVTGILRQSVAGFLSPAMAYWAVEKIALHLSRHLILKSNDLSENKIELIATPLPDVKEERFQCDNRIGMFEAVSQIFTGRYATVEHPECMHRGDRHCRYIISWESPRSLFWQRIGSYALALSVVASFLCLYFLPVHEWLTATLALLLLSTGILLAASFRRNREMAVHLRQQGKTSDDVIDQINRRYNEAQLVQEIGEAAASILDPQELLNFATDALHKRLQFDRSLVMLSNADRTRLVYGAGHGYTPHEEALLRNISFNLTNPLSRGYFYQAFINQKPFLVDSLDQSAANLSERSYKLIKDLGIKSFICVPIVFKGKTEGILAVDISAVKTKPTQSNVSLLVGVAQQIGVSLNNARAHKRVLESEERFRNLSNNSPDVIYQLDRHSAIKYVNPAWAEIFGHKPEDLIGKDFSSFLRREDQKAFEEMLQSILGDRIRVRDQYFTLFNDRGLPRSIVLSAAPDFDAEGSVVGIVGTIKDISRLRDMESQLLQASKMEAVGTLTGGIAHDFNNIIQAIMGYNQLMISGSPGNPADMSYLTSIDKLIGRARELVQQLLRFSRKSEPLARIVNLNEEIKSLHGLLAKSIPKMIDIRNDLCPDIFPVNADATQIGQIIMNLVINARDAVGDTGVITIKTDNLVLHDEARIGGFDVAPGEYVQLSVGDTGCGMAPDVMQKIFEPFFTTKKAGQGTGLGLSVVHGIVKNYSGILYCESEPGRGAAFHIILPASRTKAGRPEAEVKPKPDTRGTEKVLVVDDEKNILETVENTLTRFGYRVATAESGEAALDLYTRRTEDIDLVILDLIMPGGGGRKCLHDLKKINPRVKVLMTSGYADSRDTENLAAEGAAGFLLKPYRPQDLLMYIRRILDAPAA